MAIHYEVNIDKEPKVKRILEEIGKYIYKTGMATSLLSKDYLFKEVTIFDKTVMLLSDDYKYDRKDSGWDWHNQKDDDEFVIGTGKYDLPNSKRKFGRFWTNASLEVHYGKRGKINSVFYPL